MRFHHARTALAADVADQLQGKAAFGDAPNGLFLAAPRRTGKSTFLRTDLQPVLEARGIVVVYVDLWADKRRDPGDLVAEAIGRALAGHQGMLVRAMKKTGVDSLSVPGWVKIDVNRIGKPDGATLADALRAVQEAAQKPLVLIIDEAQHALTSIAGENAMAALKSARDQMNRPDDIQLMLVMSGSDRDKLLRLVNANGAPFYGSTISKMPLLGKDFIDHAVDVIEQQRSDLRPVDRLMLLEAFQLFGNRPQFFDTSVAEALNPMSAQGDDRFESRVLEAAKQRRELDERQFDAEYVALLPLERAVLWRLLEQGPRFRPYDAEALRFYKEKCPGLDVYAQKAQQALENLRDRTPSLVWKSARGEYSVDDSAMQAWYQQRVAASQWPPKVSELPFQNLHDLS
jgi:hypothetical protein